MLGEWLRRHLQYKEIGWTALGEVFYRYKLLKNRLFNVYLHQLDAPKWHPKCHDHPWGFVAILVWNGYLEQTSKGTYRRWPGSILFRKATFAHNVVTPYGTSWSLIITTSKSRDWGFLPCTRPTDTVAESSR